MKLEVDLKEIEQNAHRIFRQDGLTILFAGIALGIIAIFFIDVRHAWVFAVGVSLIISAPEFLRRQFVYPRIGYARFLRSKGIARHVIAICLAGICLILFYTFGKVARFNWLMPLYLGTVFSVAAFAAARRFGLSMYYVLAFISLLSGLTGLGFTIRDFAAGWVVAFQLWGLAFIMIPLGVLQFTCFLLKYPNSAQEFSDSDK
ncbi:MAG: hypothetical protein ACYTFW_11230 [Planctomycetota bacterium]|jgi:hypothetical protein